MQGYISELILRMYYVYILKSKKFDRLYVGYTNNLTKRYKQHSDGMVKSTNGYLPWRLIYYEAYENKKDAMKREKMLKTYPRTLGALKRRLHNSFTQYSVQR